MNNRIPPLYLVLQKHYLLKFSLLEKKDNPTSYTRWGRIKYANPYNSDHLYYYKQNKNVSYYYTTLYIDGKLYVPIYYIIIIIS